MRLCGSYGPMPILAQQIVVARHPSPRRLQRDADAVDMQLTSHDSNIHTDNYPQPAPPPSNPDE